MEMLRKEATETPVQNKMSYMAKAEIHKSPSPDFRLQDNGTLFTTKKPELMSYPRSDSGVASSSECPSMSPQSDRSDNHPYGSTDYATNLPCMDNGHFLNTKIPYQDWFRNAFMKFSNVPGNDKPPNQAGKLNIFSPKIKSSHVYSGDRQEQPKFKVRRSKLKQYRCKRCDFVANNKIDSWSHSKEHNSEKMLQCPLCPFVTESKHHLNYHIRNHTGAKPFKCDQCDYTCINKSMLNSHLKTHSNVYQYRCSNCSFATKYRSSLSFHLKNYKHKAAVVLNPDGSPIFFPLLKNITSSRAWPKVMRVTKSHAAPTQPQIPFNLTLNQKPLIPGFIPNHQDTESFKKTLRNRLEELVKQNEQQEALDLSCKNAPSSNSAEKNYYKYEEDMTNMFDNVEIVDNDDVQEMSSKEVRTQDEYEFSCDHCDVQFRDEVMFRIHRGFHSHSSPFTCNTCGVDCENRIHFFIHIARAAH